MRLAERMLRRKFLFISLPLLFASTVLAQDNSPYSRYGLGNQFPSTNITSRGMGGVAAAYSDNFSVNYLNPASYARFQTVLEARSRKMASGRVVLDVGMNLNSRTLATPNKPESFTATDLLFSHVYVGVPLRKNWGLSFGLRPLSRIGYNTTRRERLIDPVNHNSIDSVVTQFTGSGGSFLPSFGTGFGTDNFSIGVNIGYLFGTKELTSRRVFINDTVEYAASNHTTNSSFGDVFFNAGAQYSIDLAKQSKLRLGVAGNWKQALNASQDVMRQTFTRSAATGQELTVDSVYHNADARGEIIYPASYTAGFLYEKDPSEKFRGWSAGLDYVTNKWEDYRFFGSKDSVRSNWEIHVGAQFAPFGKPSRYAQAISYRFGFFSGKDYIKVGTDLPVFGVSLGMGLPIVNYNRLSVNQYSVVNLALEYVRRGNDNNLLKENLFRLSVGFNFTDLWFIKRRYE